MEQEIELIYRRIYEQEECNIAPSVIQKKDEHGEEQKMEQEEEQIPEDSNKKFLTYENQANEGVHSCNTKMISESNNTSSSTQGSANQKTKCYYSKDFSNFMTGNAVNSLFGFHDDKVENFQNLLQNYNNIMVTEFQELRRLYGITLSASEQEFIFNHIIENGLSSSILENVLLEVFGQDFQLQQEEKDSNVDIYYSYLCLKCLNMATDPAIWEQFQAKFNENKSKEDENYIVLRYFQDVIFSDGKILTTKNFLKYLKEIEELDSYVYRDAKRQANPETKKPADSAPN